MGKGDGQSPIDQMQTKTLLNTSAVLFAVDTVTGANAVSNDYPKVEKGKPRLVHTEGMGGYAIGAKLTKPTELLGYFKMLCDAADVDYDGRTDEQLLAIIRANKRNDSVGEGQIVDAIAELSGEPLPDETKPVTVEASQRPELATQVAAVLNASDTFNKALTTEIGHKIKARRGAIPILFELTAAFPAKDKAKRELLDSLPVPGTPQVEVVNGKQVIRNIYDTYETYKMVNTPRGAQKRKAVGSLYADIYDATTDGMQRIADASKYQKMIDDNPKHPQIVALRTKLRSLDQVRTYGLQVLRMAVRLHQQLTRFRKDLSDTINVSWIAEMGETVNNTTGAGISSGPEPICLVGMTVTEKEDGTKVSMPNAQEVMRVSVQTFCRYDVDRTVAKGGRYADLTQQGEGEPGAPEGRSITDIDTFRSFVNDAASWLMDGNSRNAIRAVVASTKDDERREFILALGDVYAFIAPFAAPDTTGGRLYEQYKKEQSNAERKRREAEKEQASAVPPAA